MISTKGRYAIRVMICLAENMENGYTPLREIAEGQGISKKYLEIIVRDLVSGGLIVGTTGKGGGYMLVRQPEEYSIGEILELTEGPLVPVACLEKGAAVCPRAMKCQTLPLWEEYNQMTHDFFYGKRLSDLLRRPKSEEGHAAMQLTEEKRVDPAAQEAFGERRIPDRNADFR